MSSVFEGSWAKLGRGAEHFNALEAELARAFDPDAYNVVLYSGEEREGRLCVTYWEVAEFPKAPENTGILVGDTVHNYRSALDHMIWTLVRRRGRMPARPSNPKKRDGRRSIQFPFARSGRSFANARNIRLPGVPDGFVNIIKRYQPYRGSYESQVFTLLERLSNIDKHRLIVPTVTGAADTEIEWWGENCEIIDVELALSPKRSLYEGYPVAFVTSVDDDGFVGRGKVHSEGVMVAHPSFGRGQDVVSSLKFMAETIAKLLDEIEAVW